MDINKAIRKQKKSSKRFMLAMGFIFFMLPVALYFSGRRSMFFLIYLGILELLILAAVLFRINYEYFSYQVTGEKLKIKTGLFQNSVSIVCEKVALVHMENDIQDPEILIVATSRFRNKKFRKVDLNFLKKYSYAGHEYTRIKKLNPEEEYFYLVLDKGGVIKYKLLADMYRSCVKAFYTGAAVEQIKKWKD